MDEFVKYFVWCIITYSISIIFFLYIFTGRLYRKTLCPTSGRRESVKSIDSAISHNHVEIRLLALQRPENTEDTIDREEEEEN